MPCKTNGAASRTAASRRAGVRLAHLPRHGCDSVVGAMRTVVAPAAFARAAPSLSEIRKRAYFIYLSREGANGDASSDWLEAERELCEELRAAARDGRRF